MWFRGFYLQCNKDSADTEARHRTGKGQWRGNIEGKHRAVRREKRGPQRFAFWVEFEESRDCRKGRRWWCSRCSWNMKAEVLMVEGPPGAWLWPSLRDLNGIQWGNVRSPKSWNWKQWRWGGLGLRGNTAQLVPRASGSAWTSSPLGGFLHLQVASQCCVRREARWRNVMQSPACLGVVLPLRHLSSSFKKVFWREGSQVTVSRSG